MPAPRCCLAALVILTTLVACGAVAEEEVLVKSLRAAPPTAASCTAGQFSLFMTAFNRTYVDAKEHALRYSIFCANWEAAKAVQRRNPHADFGVTMFMDRTDDEFMIYATGHPKGAKISVRDPVISAKRALNFSGLFSDSEIVEKARAGLAMDWRTRGAVTSVKAQGSCGSCWAFSATANVESTYFIASGVLNSLSEQELVSCVPNQYCVGGSIDTAFAWLIDTQGGGMTLDVDYPYVSGGGYVPACPAGPYPLEAWITSYGNLPQYNEPYMASYLATYRPVSVGVDCDSWKYYNGGVLTDCAATQMNHAVIIIGVDTGNSPPFWTIKNSWGTGWGEQGYIRIAYGQDTCMVSSAPCASIGS